MDVEKAKALCRSLPESRDALGDAEAAALLHRSYELVFGKLTRKLQRAIAGGT